MAPTEKPRRGHSRGGARRPGGRSGRQPDFGQRHPGLSDRPLHFGDVASAPTPGRALEAVDEESPLAPTAAARPAARQRAWAGGTALGSYLAGIGVGLIAGASRVRSDVAGVPRSPVPRTWRTAVSGWQRWHRRPSLRPRGPAVVT